LVVDGLDREKTRKAKKSQRLDNGVRGKNRETEKFTRD